MRALLDRLGWRGWVLPVTLLVLALLIVFLLYAYADNS